MHTTRTLPSQHNLSATAPLLKESVMTFKSSPLSAVYTAEERQRAARVQAEHMNPPFPVGDLPATPLEAPNEEDTPVYWQTLQAMASAPRRLDW